MYCEQCGSKAAGRREILPAVRGAGDDGTGERGPAAGKAAFIRRPDGHPHKFGRYRQLREHLQL